MYAEIHCKMVTKQTNGKTIPVSQIMSLSPFYNDLVTDTDEYNNNSNNSNNNNNNNNNINNSSSK